MAATTIDITLSLNITVADWQVSDSETFSDHKMITFSLSEVISSKTKFHNLRKTDWDAFHSHVESACADATPPRLISRAWIDSETRHLTAILTKAVQATSPLAVRPSKVRPPSFFTDEIRTARSLANSLFKQYKHSHSPDDWDAYTCQRRELHRLVRVAKRSSWKTFTSSASLPKDVSRLVKCVQHRMNARVDLLAGKQTPQESLSCLFDTHFPGCRPIPTSSAAPGPGPPGHRSRSPARRPPSPTFRTRNERAMRGVSCTRWEDVHVPLVTLEKVRWSIKAFGPYKAAGDDGVSPVMLQHCGPLFLQRLVTLYKAMLHLAYTPESMRCSKVIFIPKQGKSDYTVPKAFRPISLTSVLFKVLERVVLDSLQSSVIGNMNRRQHAFRKGSSCDSALSAMADRIERHILNNEYALGVFLDIAGAFDNLSFQAAISGMERAGVDPLIIAWYSHYLRNRTAWADLKGCSLLVCLVQGTPQGGVLSPIIWNLAFESFLTLFFFGPVYAQAFADDGALLTGGRDPSELVRIMQKALDKVWEWSRAIGLTFSPAKTEVVIFTRRNGPYQGLFPPLTFGLPLMYSTQVKYLGILLDRRLNYRAHIRAQCKKGTRLLKAVQSAIGKLWGPSPLALKWAYEMMVKPMLLYGAIVWGFHTSGVLTPLQRVQRLAMLSCGFFLKSTPTKGMEVIFHFPPLDLLSREEARAAALRIRDRNRPVWDGVGRGASHGHLHLAHVDLGELDRLPSFTQWDDRATLDEDSLLSGTPNSDLPGLHCYTDGSKFDDGPVGYGYVIKAPDDPTLDVRGFGTLGCEAEVFQGEVVAITEAARALSELPPYPIVLHVDSKPALQAVTKPECVSRTVRTCREAITSLVRRQSVSFRWVKAHAGHALNELADDLAKAGTQSDHLVSVPLPWKRVRRHLRELTLCAWRERWAREVTCRQTKLLFPEPRYSFSKPLFKLNRMEFSLVVQFVTGHNFLKYHLSHVHDTTDVSCRLCQDDTETSWHILAECPVLLRHRVANLATMFPEAGDPIPLDRLHRFIRGEQVIRLLTPPEEDHHDATATPAPAPSAVDSPLPPSSVALVSTPLPPMRPPSVGPGSSDPVPLDPSSP